MTTTAALAGNLTIQTVRTTQPQLVAALSSQTHIEIDLSRVDEIDSAGLQLLIAAKHEAIAQHKTLQFIALSDPVLDALLFFDMGELLWRSDRVAKKIAAARVERLFLRDIAVMRDWEAGAKILNPDDDTIASDNWHLSLRFDRDVFLCDEDPQKCLRYLCRHGEIVNLVTLIDKVPRLSFLDVEACHLGFEINFRSWSDRVTMESAFELIRKGCQIKLLPPHSPIAEYVRLIQEPTELNLRLGEILIRCGTLTLAELQTALLLQAEN